MDIEVRGVSFSITKPINGYVSTRVNRSLTRFRPSIRKVIVRLGDINGERRGGEDKSCKVIAKLWNGKQLLVEHTSEDLYASVDAAVSRLDYIIGKSLTRNTEAAQQRALKAERTPKLKY